MSHDTPRPSRPRNVITGILGGLALAVLVGLGLYGLILGPPPTGEAPPSTDLATTASTPRPELVGLPETNDAEKYALGLARALFTWDTFTTHQAANYQGVITRDADPSGTETPGLLADITGYFPSVSEWKKLREYRTVQTLTNVTATVPEQWAEALAISGGEITDGTHAYTITGTRNRTGTWYGKPVTTTHPVAFTVFFSCAPANDRCHVLRLSALDTPLQ